MSKSRLLKNFFIVLVVVINIGCDQVSKKMVRENVRPEQTIQLIRNHVTITNVENTGAFLSAGDNLPKATKNILLALLPVIALALGMVFIFSNHQLSKFTVAGICFVIGGGIGNVLDRIVYGSVTDFLHIDFGIFQTGIFNLADMSIMTGAALLLTQLLFFRK
jgi:lipoprotein signal peptidase